MSRSSGARILVLVAVIALGLLSALGIAAWFLLPQYLLSRIESEAGMRGITLQSCKLELGWPTLVLQGCEVATGGATAGERVSGKVDTISITLEHYEPKKVLVTGAALSMHGVPDFDKLFERRTPSNVGNLEIEVTQSTFAWSPMEGQVAVLRLSDLQYKVNGGDLAAADFTGKVDVAGALAGTLSRANGLIQLNLSPVKDPNTKLDVRIEQARALGELRLDFTKLELSKLIESGLPLIPKDLAQVSVDGQIYAQIPIGLNPTPAKGDLRLTLHNLNFPVPLELQGLVYGTPAELTSTFSLDRSYSKAELKKTNFKVGALDMHGQGKLTLNGLAVGYELSLSGQLACDAIVRSAVSAHASSELAKLAGLIAKKGLQGSVAIFANIVGNTAQPEATKVTKTVGLGCGLKPSLLDQLPQLPDLPLDGLPLPAPGTSLDDARNQLGKLPDLLDKNLPKLPLPEPKTKPKTKPKQDSKDPKAGSHKGH